MEIDEIIPTQQEIEDIEKEEQNISFSSESIEDEDNPSPIEKPNNKKGIKLHTIKSKIKVVKYAMNHNISQAADKFLIPRTIINDWYKNRYTLLNIPIKDQDKKSLNKGRARGYLEQEKKLCSFILFNRKLFNPISTMALLVKFLEIIPERKKKKVSTNLKFLYRFLKHYGYTYRNKTHSGKMLEEGCFFKHRFFSMRYGI